jgi:hypothetical protein
MHNRRSKHPCNYWDLILQSGRYNTAHRHKILHEELINHQHIWRWFAKPPFRVWWSNNSLPYQLATISSQVTHDIKDRADASPLACRVASFGQRARPFDRRQWGSGINDWNLSFHDYFLLWSTYTKRSLSFNLSKRYPPKLTDRRYQGVRGFESPDKPR